MHGVKRVREQKDPEAVAAAKREKEAKAVAEYRSLLDDFNARRKEKDVSSQTFAVTTKLLSKNPDFQSCWNYRRNVIQSMLKDADISTRQALYKQEIQLSTASLAQNPKVYCVWDYRKWVLESMPFPDWGKEIAQIEMLLNMDGRNFHVWDYRRYVVAILLALPPEAFDPNTRPLAAPQLPKITIEKELEFTRSKISKDLGNFSAWHYRTKMFVRRVAEQQWTPTSPERAVLIDSEFDLVVKALWTDPSIQSAWFYHRWLVGFAEETGVESFIAILRRELKNVEELYEFEPDSRWCMDALVRYRLQLIQLENLGESQSNNVRRECNILLQKLQDVDKDHRQRYIDLGRDLQVSS